MSVASKPFARIVNAEGETLVSLVGPARSDDALSVALRLLTQQLHALGLATTSGGGFGGAYGYGARFENDVFLMSPDYQDAECNCGHDAAAVGWDAENPHADNCYQALLHDGRLIGPCTPVLRALCNQFGIPWNDGVASMRHCTCGRDARWHGWVAEHPHAERCLIVLPNFWHKPTNLKVRWYKYIGREMRIECGADVRLFDVLTSTLASIGTTLDAAAIAYEQAEREADEAMRRSIAFVNSDEGRELLDRLVADGVIQTFTCGSEKKRKRSTSSDPS